MFGRNRKQEDRASLPGELFPPVDFDAIGKELRLEVRGLENGRAGYPDSDATDLDPEERKAVAATGKLRRQGLENAAEHERVYRERIAAADAIGPQIQRIANDTETDFRREVDVRRNLLNSALHDLHSSEADLAQFKQDNHLNRTALETGGLWKWATLCFALILAESFMNGFFFQETSVRGLVGGIIIALGISLVNVISASFAGHAYRQKNHTKLLRKFAGFLFLIVGTWLAVFINFLVGHFRDLTATIPWDEAAGAAFERVIAGHVRMQSLDAWLLTGLGMLIAAIAGWKAYEALDPYPGYGRVAKNFGTKRDEWQDLLEETFEALIETRDKATTALRDECDKLQERFDTAEVARAGLLTLMDRRRDFLRECDQITDDLLAVYRDANRKARATPEPAHFRQAFSFPAEEELVGPLPRSPDSVGRFADLAEKAVERIHRACQDAMDSFGDERSSRA